MNLKRTRTLIVGLLLLLLLAGCAEPVEVEVTRIVTEVQEVETIVEITRVVTEVQEVEVEVTRIVSAESDAASMVSLATLAKSIQDGEIEVGDEYGMGLEERFHVIHADVIDMKCTQCHVQDAPLEIAQPANVTEDAPGIVDRRVCLGCHLNGPATAFYDPKE